MNKFKIAFSDEATGDQIAAIGKALEAKDAEDVQQDPNGFYTAKLEWGTDQKSLNNLKGYLNTFKKVNNAVTSVTAI